LIKKGEGTTNTVPQNVVGLIPAGGTGSRIAPLPMSKELFPIGFQKKGDELPSLKVVSHYLIEKFAKAGIRKTFIIIRSGKWDIPAYYGDGTSVNMHVGYLMMGDPFGPPFTLDQAYPFVQNHIVAFGFPDIMISSDDVFMRLQNQQAITQADVVLATFPAHNPQVMDMVEIDETGKVRALLLKPKKTDLQLCWLCGVWTPVFTQFMHEYVDEYRRKNELSIANVTNVNAVKREDLTVGEVIQAAIIKGLKIHGVTFPDGRYIDIGTPDDLMKSVGMYGCQLS
jgi:glucose-1-phosphate thymidylyltransferase